MQMPSLMRGNII